ncbi:MAG: hypothetical protein L3K06_07470, partial [Thermoplasmata archaeon]|nr:hypothetical protein [Thermoplasmata archaeon]
MIDSTTPADAAADSVVSVDSGSDTGITGGQDAAACPGCDGGAQGQDGGGNPDARASCTSGCWDGTTCQSGTNV